MYGFAQADLPARGREPGVNDEQRASQGGNSTEGQPAAPDGTGHHEDSQPGPRGVRTVSAIVHQYTGAGSLLKRGPISCWHPACRAVTLNPIGPEPPHSKGERQEIAYP